MIGFPFGWCEDCKEPKPAPDCPDLCPDCTQARAQLS